MTQVQTFAENIIDAERLGSEQPLTIPQAPKPNGGDVVDSVVAESRMTALQQVSQAKEQAETATAESKSQISGRISEMLGLQQDRSRQEEAAGIPRLSQEIADITSQIEGKEHALRRRIEELQRQPGLTKDQVNAQVADLQRRTAFELADLSIIQNARLRNMEALQSSIDRRINLEMEALQFQLQFDKMFHQENFAALTAEENREFQLKLVQEERVYNERLQDKQAVGEIMKQAALFGASPLVIGEIANSRNVLEALVASGNALGAGFQMEREAMDMQRESMEFNQSMAVKELNFKKQMYADSQRQRQEDVLRAMEEGLIAEAEENESKAEAALAIKQTLTGLDTHPGMSSAVGFGTKKSLIGSIPFVSGEATSGTARKDFEVQTTRLSNMFLVDNLDKMTGVLTDKDLEILRSEGTTIGDFDQSEESWLKEYQRIMDMVDRGLKEHGITTEQAKFYYGFEDSTIEGVRDVYELNETSTKAFNPANFY